jgi:hypothetical protein
LFEMEQKVPGADPADPYSDPITESVELKETGDHHGAMMLLMKTVEADLRCLDAHAHLGNIWFDQSPARAMRHYEMGVLIGELSLGEDFDGALTWGLIDNRPFLRCLAGYGLCLWRLERFGEALTVFTRLLRLNPPDNQGIRFLIDPVQRREPWRKEEAMDMHFLAGLPVFDWPADAHEDILAVLQDRQAPSDERLLAAELAGDLNVIEDILAQELLRILEDPSETDTLRGQAAISMGPVLEEGEMMGFDEPESLVVSEDLLPRMKGALRRVFDDPGAPKETRRRALEASVRAPEAWHADAIRVAYLKEDHDWKLTAVFCMRFVPGFEAQIVEALDLEEVDILYQALWAAADQGVAGAWPFVQRLVLAAESGTPILPDDPEAERALLLAAINGVATIRPLEAHVTLSPLLEMDDEELAEIAAEVLDFVEALWTPEDQDLEDEPTWH